MDQYIHFDIGEEVPAVKPSQSAPCHAASEAVFGSWARGTKDRLSDRDILIVDDDVTVLRSRADALAAEGWSVASYTFRKLNALAARKVLFVQHLKLESKILHDSDGRLAALLDSYLPKSAYVEELDANRRLGNLVASIGEGARAEAWAADLLYVTVRNFGVLSLASRNIHLYAYEQILDALTDVAILAPDAAPKLQRLRFIKYLYRSGERAAPGRVLGVVRDALAVLPSDAFPDAVKVMPARALLNFPAPGAGEAAYLILRDLEKRMIAAQTLSGGKLVDPELAALERWVADPRVYANLSLSMSDRLRQKLANFGRDTMADPKGATAPRAR